MSYPNWLLRAGEAFERCYDDASSGQEPVVLEDALLEAFAAATNTVLKPHFKAEMMLARLKQDLEDYRTVKLKERYHNAIASN